MTGVRPANPGQRPSQEDKTMIKGAHTMFYTSEPEALRAFLRDKLGFPHTDVGGGWLIFDLPEADMGCHPSDESGEHGKSNGTHDISFYCDDIEKTVEEMKGKGVIFDGVITDEGFGKVIRFIMPGDLRVQLYEPFYTKGTSG